MNNYKKILVTRGTGVVVYTLQDLQPEHPEQQFIFANSKLCDLTNSSETVKFINVHKSDVIVKGSVL